MITYRYHCMYLLVTWLVWSFRLLMLLAMADCLEMSLFIGSLLFGAQLNVYIGACAHRQPYFLISVGHKDHNETGPFATSEARLHDFVRLVAFELNHQWCQDIPWERRFSELHCVRDLDWERRHFCLDEFTVWICGVTARISMTCKYCCCQFAHEVCLHYFKANFRVLLVEVREYWCKIYCCCSHTRFSPHFEPSNAPFELKVNTLGITSWGWWLVQEIH